MSQPAPDRETADFLIGHINNPCEVEVYPGHTENLRDFYLREAERILPTMTDPVAQNDLQAKVNQYRRV